MTERVERRADVRFRVDLTTEISADGSDGRSFLEKTVLRNMSCGGAYFLTDRVDRYFRGQRLRIKVDLPQTPDVKACLAGSAIVSRIDSLPESETGHGLRRHAVAVVIAVPLKFIRINGKPQASPPGTK